VVALEADVGVSQLWQARFDPKQSLAQRKNHPKMVLELQNWGI